jgi:hypothetical protein
MQSVAQTEEGQIVGWEVNNELERMGKEAAII